MKIGGKAGSDLATCNSHDGIMKVGEQFETTIDMMDGDIGKKRTTSFSSG